MKLKNKVAIITGSSRGIGRATALLFAQEGAQVVINYKSDEQSAQAVQKQIGKNAIVVQADLTKENDVKKLITETIRAFGKIDILVNNAGEIIRPGDWKGDVETWQSTLDVNLTSMWLTIREAAPHLKAQKNAAIVNVTSIYGLLGAAPVLAYTAAKGAVVTLTKSFAKELAPTVRVNAIAPSNVKTDMTKGAGEDLIKFFISQTPLRRIAEPEELAKAILFLASEDASYITGETLKVDGGYSSK